MYRVVDVGPEGGPRLSEGPEAAGPPAAGIVRWIDLEDHDSTELRLLAERFNFHPLTIEDCEHFDQRPKLDEYGDYWFVVVHGFVCRDDDPKNVDALELHAFLGSGYLITVHERAIPALTEVWKRASTDAALARRGADYLYYLVVDGIVDTNFQHLDTISEELDAIEDAVLQRAQRGDLAQIFALKRVLVMMRRTLSPQRDVFALLAKRGGGPVSDRTAFYFRDVYDHLVRIYESIDTARDLLGNALDAYLSMVAQRTNDVMKSLTILSAIFLPLTFVTGFFGQNFEHLPFGSDALMFAMTAACVAIPLAMLVWFKARGWL